MVTAALADVVAIAIASTSLAAMCVACWPRRSRALEQIRKSERASIRAAFSCRGKLVHLGRPEILAILNARDDGRERREIPDLAARALRLERCLQAQAQRTTAPIGRAARRRRRRRPPAGGHHRRSSERPAGGWYTTFARAIGWLGLLVARALERGLHLWH